MIASRRSLIASGFVAGSLVPTLAQAYQATPEATVPTPEDLFQALLETPITTPLLPTDLGPPTSVEWIDDSDDDLTGTVGGVLVQAGEGDDAPLLGVYIVHASPEAATTALDPSQAGESYEVVPLLGLVGGSYRTEADDFSPASTLVAVANGPVIVSAVGEGDDVTANDLRALATLTGLLDHLRMVRGS